MARDHRRAMLRLAAACWFTAGALYLATEGMAAYAFSPSYSYAYNYISDLGVPVCGIVFDGRAICSPLHLLINWDFFVQGLLFLAAALAVARSISARTKFALVAFAALNGIGNGLIATYPENAPGQLTAALSCHVVGAVLAIVFGNGTALMSVWTFRELGLPSIHRYASLALPLLAAVSLAMLADTSETMRLFPVGICERLSVYTITAWELLSAACVMGRTQRR